jgi:hypothetical protein
MIALAGLIALVAAIGVTPVGQEWADAIAGGASDVLDDLQGRFS